MIRTRHTTPAELADKHYDYWALGHIHQRGRHEVEAPRWWCSVGTFKVDMLESVVQKVVT